MFEAWGEDAGTHRDLSLGSFALKEFYFQSEAAQSCPTDLRGL